MVEDRLGSLLEQIARKDFSPTVKIETVERVTAAAKKVTHDLLRWQDDQLGLVHDREACDVCREGA